MFIYLTTSIFLITYARINAQINDDETEIILDSPEGRIKFPNDDNHTTIRWILRAQTGYKINLFLDYYNLFGCDDNITYEYLKIGPILDSTNGNSIYYNTCKKDNLFNDYLDGSYFKFTSVYNYMHVEYKSNIIFQFRDSFSLMYRTYSELTNDRLECNDDEIKCLNTNTCINKNYTCDCYNDCSDLSDEYNCDLENKCNKFELNYNSSEIYCLDYDTKLPTYKPNSFKCDNKFDCYNQIDEYNCNTNNNNNDCINVYKTDNYGTISSPNYPNNYDLGLNCSYHIIVEPYQKIQIRLKKLKLRPYYLTNPLTYKPSLTSYLTTNDYDFISIYDGDNIYAPLIAHLNSQQNNNDLKQKIFNSKSNSILILFHTSKNLIQPGGRGGGLAGGDLSYSGFNLTYQVKGLCIDDQQSCSTYTVNNNIIRNELNCYDSEQRCDDIWDCHNGADEHGCSNCPNEQFKCRNRLSCYKYEDRCDGDAQCIDKSDELNCDAWFCNSDNGTFLCANKRCIYEQWVCDGTNDCDDNSDENNCPTPFTRRVITTAVLGGTLCLLLLVMALGCACKLYTLRTDDYRASVRLTSSRRRRERNSNRSSNNNRRAFSLINLIRRNNNNNNNSNISNTSTASNNSNTSNPNNIYRLVRSASMSSIDYQNLIAPPTYNQTMGLVDEYEQRQLAFIEHVRSIINSNNTQTQNGSQNTTTHNSSSRSHRRRSHSSRHSSRLTNPNQITTDANNPTNSTANTTTTTTTTNINSNDQTIIHQSSRHHRRRHRHHRQNGHHHHHHHHHHHESSRRGCSSSTTPTTTSGSQPTRPTTLNPLQQQENNTTTNTTQAINNNTNISKVTTNLKDRLAKLIKDIVNHGDSIQYVQLSDTSSINSRSQNNFMQQQQQQQQNQIFSSNNNIPTITPTQSIPLDSPIQQNRNNNTTNVENKNTERDDAKLIDS